MTSTIAKDIYPTCLDQPGRNDQFSTASGDSEGISETALSWTSQPYSSQVDQLLWEGKD